MVLSMVRNGRDDSSNSRNIFLLVLAHLSPTDFLHSIPRLLGEPLGKRLCEGLVIFESRFRNFIDQIFGTSKSGWIFSNCCNEFFFIPRPPLQ